MNPHDDGYGLRVEPKNHDFMRDVFDSPILKAILASKQISKDNAITLIDQICEVIIRHQKKNMGKKAHD